MSAGLFGLLHQLEEAIALRWRNCPSVNETRRRVG
jgi:hypothetical protein